MQLEVEEHRPIVLEAERQHARSLGDEQLETDLQHSDRGRDAGGEHACVGCGGDVEREDDAAERHGARVRQTPPRTNPLATERTKDEGPDVRGLS